MKNIIGLIFLALSINLFSQSYTDVINIKDEFFKLSGLPLSDKYGQVTALKVVYDLKTDNLYFINSKYFKYHYEFCNYQILHENLDLEYFNRINYSNDKHRRFLLANINYFESINVFALEVSPVDLMVNDQIFFLFDQVSKNCCFGDSLKFLLNSSRLLNQEETLKSNIPIIKSESVYSNANYQAISKHSTYGVLRFIDDIAKQVDELSPMDIIVINETPAYLPNVAGVIVTELQTPLSHLTILGQNRKIPICAYRKAFDDQALKKFENQKIKFEVLGSNYKIENADEIQSSKTHSQKIKLVSDLSVDSLVDVDDLDKKSFKFCGNKASNFGVLYDLSQKANFKTPESAFVIPFYFYDQHVKKSGVDVLIDSLLSNELILNNQDSLQISLKRIRQVIKETAIDSNLLQSIVEKGKSKGDYLSFRFRSSTNAEDTKGFSGAGLYTSKTGILYDQDKSIEKAIKSVWASLWSYQAFLERMYFNLNQKEIYMGLLVHRSFSDEKVNGVAITKNLYRSDSYGFVINAQLGDESVVKPKAGNMCDQFICYPNDADNIYENKNTVDIITTSNLNNGELVMDDSEIQNLANQLEIVKEYFINHTLTSKSFLDFGLDIEFKLDGEYRDLYLKQVRLFND